MTAKAVLGIDPGVRGAMTLLRIADGSLAGQWGFQGKMAENELAGAIRAAVTALRMEGGGPCYMEKVGFIRGDGGLGSFTFGKVVGLIRGCLLTHEVDIIEVYPVMWQGFLGCLTGGDKNVSKAKAIELFPGVKITHGTADSMLIAEYGRRRFMARAV